MRALDAHWYDRIAVSKQLTALSEKGKRTIGIIPSIIPDVRRLIPPTKLLQDQDAGELVAVVR